MAYTFDVNRASMDADGGFHFYYLKEALKAAGWTHVASGDGLAAFSAAVDQITGPGTGANGFDNGSAWWCGRQPAGGAAPYAGTRQVVFQVGAGSGVGRRFTARIVYSQAGTANMGAASATRVPAFTDENIVYGSGTPAAPGFAALFQNGLLVAVTEILAGGAAENFSFSLNVIPTALNLVSGGVSFDGLTNYVPGDLDPFVFMVKNAGWIASTLENIAFAFQWSVFNGTPAARNVQMRGNPASSAFAGGGIDYQRENPINSKIDLVQVYYTRPNTVAAPGGWKGVSTLWKWRTLNKAIKSTLSVAAPGARDRIVLEDLVTFWDGSVPT
jgi:hypothetical protein